MGKVKLFPTAKYTVKQPDPTVCKTPSNGILWSLLCKSTFSAGFSRLFNEPAKLSKTVGHSIKTISTPAPGHGYGLQKL